MMSICLFYAQQAKTIVWNNWCLVISFSSSSNNEFNYEPRQTISLGGIDCPSSQLSSLGAFYREGDIMASFSAIFSGDKKGNHHPEQNRNKIYLRELYRSSHIFLTTSIKIFHRTYWKDAKSWFYSSYLFENIFKCKTLCLRRKEYSKMVILKPVRFCRRTW